MKQLHTEETADICLILEGCYPYVPGGVSSWTQSLIKSLPDKTFHLYLFLAPSMPEEDAYDVPDNVIGRTERMLQALPSGARKVPKTKTFLDKLEQPLINLQHRKGGLDDIKRILEEVDPFRDKLGRHLLLNTKHSWEKLLRMYYLAQPKTSFLDYFWSWRAMTAGLYSVLLGPMPKAKVYHAISTGYAGLLLARAALETNRPALLTEHGIYTNERRIEIAMADWLYEVQANNLSIENPSEQLRDMWVRTFISYSRACYEASAEIITLYEGNQAFQLKDDAPAEKLRVIPNGINYELFSGIEPSQEERPPTVALIGRVVPIKDIKTFIRSADQLRKRIPDVRVWLLGPFGEEPEYHEECVQLVKFLKLEETFFFKGRVNLVEYLGHVDVLVLTSISEAQPLVILEAGAAGIPSVATDVGSCRELIMGMRNEEPKLGPGGAVTPLADPTATANACYRLLADNVWRARCAHAIKTRVERYYNKRDQDRSYRELYEHYIPQPDSPQGAFERWPGLDFSFES